MATVRYVDVRELQPPFDLGELDADSRAQWVFNIQATKVPSATFAQELIIVLLAATVVTAYGTDVFDSVKSVVPAGDGPYVSIRQTGGPDGLRTHNVTAGPAYERATAQITVHARDARTAETKARAAYAALLALKNTDVTVP